MIPKLFHQIWVDFGIGQPDPPQKYADNSAEWQKRYPDFQYKLWRRAELLELVRVVCPWLFERLEHLQGRSRIVLVDAIRPLLLHIYGGFYVDLDAKPGPKSLEDFLGFEVPVMAYCDVKENLFGSKHNPQRKTWLLVNNCFMASPPKHWFWLHIVDVMERTIRRHQKPGKPLGAVSVLWQAGPFMYSCAIKSLGPKMPGKPEILKPLVLPEYVIHASDVAWLGGFVRRCMERTRHITH